MENKRPSGDFRPVCLYTALFSALAHAYRYLSVSFSGDSMLLSQVGEEAYQTSLGRFLQPVYWQIRGYITAPLLIGLFATVFLICAALIIVRLLELKKPVHIAIACGILATNETLAASNAAYLPWTDVYMLALLLSVLGVFVFFRFRWGWLLSPLFYCLSLGLYQSYLPAASTLIILVLMIRTLEGTPVKTIWQRGVAACISLVLGLLLYALVLNIILALSGGQASQDYNGVGRVGALSAGRIPILLSETYLLPLRFLFSLSDTPAMTWHISLIPAPLNIAIFALTIPMLFCRIKQMNLSSRLTLAFLLLVLPLSINFIHFIADGISSGLTIYAYYLLYLIPLLLAARPQSDLSGKAKALSCTGLRLSVCALALLLFLNIGNSNRMSVKRDLEFSATTSAMARILDHAEQTLGYVPGETPVVLIGMLPSSLLSMERPGFGRIAGVQGMRYTYGAAYETSNYWYLQMALGEPINLVSHPERMERSASEEARALPLFPLDGCCRMIDGCLYIRIS